jgi:hypothetical protein
MLFSYPTEVKFLFQHCCLKSWKNAWLSQKIYANFHYIIFCKFFSSLILLNFLTINFWMVSQIQLRIPSSRYLWREVRGQAVRSTLVFCTVKQEVILPLRNGESQKMKNEKKWEWKLSWMCDEREAHISRHFGQPLVRILHIFFLLMIA